MRAPTNHVLIAYSIAPKVVSFFFVPYQTSTDRGESKKERSKITGEDLERACCYAAAAADWVGEIVSGELGWRCRDADADAGK